MTGGFRTYVSAKAHTISLCGVNGEFPFKFGNYFSNAEDYYFVNLWYENLEYLLDNGIIDDGKIEALLFKYADSDSYVYAYVIDERVPKEALHAPYFCGIKTSVEIVRMHHKVPDDKCLCEVDDYNLTSKNGWDNKGMARYTCPQCKTYFEVQRKRKSGVYRVKTENCKGDYDWVLAWFDGDVFKAIPDMTTIDSEVIVVIDDTRVNEFGTIDNQRTALPMDKFMFTGLKLRKEPAK